MTVASSGRLALYPLRDAPLGWLSEDYGVRGSVTVGDGANRRPFAGGAYALLSLAPWRTLLDVEPSRGWTGTAITVAGTAFDPAAQLFVGGKPATGAQIPGPTQATGATPPLRRCIRHAVSVVNPDMSYELLEDAFLAQFGLTLCHTRPGAP